MPAPAAGPARSPGPPPVTYMIQPSVTSGSRNSLNLGTSAPGGGTRPAVKLREGSTRFDSAKQAWEQLGQPYADQLEATRGQVAQWVAELEQAQKDREAFLAKHSDVPRRLAELGRAIEHEQELQRRQSYEHIMQREQARHVGIWRAPDTSLGIDL